MNFSQTCENLLQLFKNCELVFVILFSNFQTSFNCFFPNSQKVDFVWFFHDLWIFLKFVILFILRTFEKFTKIFIVVFSKVRRGPRLPRLPSVAAVLVPRGPFPWRSSSSGASALRRGRFRPSQLPHPSGSLSSMAALRRRGPLAAPSSVGAFVHRGLPRRASTSTLVHRGPLTAQPRPPSSVGNYI